MNTVMIILAIVIVLSAAFIVYQFVKHAKAGRSVQHTGPEYVTTRASSDTSSLETVQRTNRSRSEPSNVYPAPATSATMYDAPLSDSVDRSSSSDSSSSDSGSSSSSSSSSSSFD